MAIYRGPGGSGDATTDATNQASVASDAAAAALVSQTAAANSATNAATSATAAASSASGASTSATNAANSATSATSSASTATTQAGIATTQATNAATSATNAATSAANAATTYDNFDDRYLGSKASAPTLDNDGNALLTGALYWNSTSNTMNVWTGSAWTGLGGSSGVSSFNTRTGAVTLSSSDVTTALTYTPPSTTGSGATGTWNIDILGSAGTVTNGVYTTGNQTIGGTKTFSSTISGSIDGNAATVTNGVVTTGSYSDPTWLTISKSKVGLGNVENTALSTWAGSSNITTVGTLGTLTVTATITGSVSGNAGTVTNGVYTTGSYANPSWITSLAETKVLPSQTGNSGKYLTTNGTSTSWATVTGGGASALDDLTDVVLTSPSTGQVLKYNGTNWVNDTDSVGSGSFAYPSAGIAVSTGTAWGTSLTDNSSNWNTAYTDRLKWDGGSTGLTASTGRTSLGATTVGSNLFTLANPGAITFPRFNADNSVSSLNASDFRTAIGAGTSSTTGTVTSVSGTGTVSGLSLSGTVTSTGNITLGGTLSVAASNFASQTANTFLAAPNGSTGTPSFRSIAAADIPTLNQNTTGTAANVTGKVEIANGGTGEITAAAAFNALNPMTTVGDIIYENTGPTAARLPIGTNGQVLTVVSGLPAWAAAGGSMVYPGAGIPNSTGSAWGTSYTTSGTGTVVALATTPTLTNPTFTGFTETIPTAISGTTPAITPTTGTIQTWTLTGTSTPTAGTWAAGQSLTLMIDDGTTAFTISWASLPVTWVGGTAPTLASTGFTVIELWKVGTTIYGALVGAVA